MEWKIGTAANLVVMVMYFAIVAAILVPLIKEKQVRANRLGTATAAIFFTCAVHHGSHSVHMLLPTFGIDASSGYAMRDAFDGTQVVWDIITAGMGNDLRQQIVFIGETAAALLYALRHPGTIRWRDVWRICERVGADALPIVALISFLLGVILAFQSAIPMKKFGAEIFVADLIGLAMLRELGPLMTAILLAGRSGAAFAAEIGTMTVNQEVDALTTMGLDPVRFLVTPRIIAALLMTPLLTLFADLISLVGGAMTLQSFSIPWVTFVHEVESIVDFADFMAGFVKSFVFAILIAGIGCLRGLQTAAGASAVGDAATRAVVSGIILLVVVDGVFAVIYFVLDI